jgi:tetratricopeptide (TPR) repeat protein
LTKVTFAQFRGQSRWRKQLRCFWLIFASFAVGLPLVVGSVAANVNRQPLKRSLKVTPALSTLVNEGLAHYRAGRSAAALIAWRRALVLSPNDAGVHNNIGIALIRLGQPSEARISFQKAIALEPNQELFTNNLDWANRELAQPGADPVASPRTR